MNRPMLNVLPVVAASTLFALGLTLMDPQMAFSQLTKRPVVIDPGAGIEPDLGGPDFESRSGSASGSGTGVTPMVAPIPFKNTQLGWGMMLMGGAIHRFDADTTIRPSMGAVGGFYSENKSWGLTAVENARFGRDRWRMRLMAAHMDVRYDYYGTGEDAGEEGLSIGIQQTANMANLTGLRRVVKDVYLGATGLYMLTSVALRDTTRGGEPPSSGDLNDLTLFAMGLQGEVDTRDSDFWPTRGTLARAKTWFFLDALGAGRSFQRYVAFWSWYFPLMSEDLVLAANVNAAGAGGDAPFWTLPSVGFGRGGLRGYTQGRYRDAVMTTEQVELRYQFGRFGAVAFGGLGHVAPTVGDIFEAAVLPAGGVGARFQLTKKYPMNLRFDYSWGRDGSIFYFSVAEAF